MSNYEGNPVGMLFEKYQSSGKSPLYEVIQVKGEAHAPTFQANLEVPEGHKVEATGSSKKIARNLASKLMLDKLKQLTQTRIEATDQDNHQMSNYEGNPVGMLFEKYQSSGKSPLYEVIQVKGEAHAPTFQANLEVPEGHKVEATGSSKKIARNLAAKLMLDKLKQLSLTRVEATDKDNRYAVECNNNNVRSPSLSPVACFYLELKDKSGPMLDQVRDMKEVEQDAAVGLLDQLGGEQGFRLEYRPVGQRERGELDKKEMTLMVQLTGMVADKEVATVCLGNGRGTRQAMESAACCALTYIRIMARKYPQQGT